MKERESNLWLELIKPMMLLHQAKVSFIYFLMKKKKQNNNNKKKTHKFCGTLL